MPYPENRAELVLDELCITSPEDLRNLDLIAYARGATVVYEPLTGAEARLVVAGKRAIITISTRIADPRRRRFSVGHDLGHLEIHRRHSSLFLCTGKDLNTWGKRETDANLEQEANKFAAALLLPERFVAPLCSGDPSLDLVSDIAGEYNVSLTATAVRYLRFCVETCAVVFSQEGYIQWFQTSDEFERVREDTGIFVDVHSKVDPTTQAGKYFAGRSNTNAPRRVRASAWFKPGRYRDDASIVEQSWPMPDYQAVLTLLWVDDDLEYEDETWPGII